MSYITALTVTIAAEYFILLLFYRKKPLLSLLYIFLINLFTHPLANLIYETLLPAFSYGTGGIELIPFLIVEIFVILTEWILIKLLFEFSYVKSLLISLACNFITAALSFVI